MTAANLPWNHDQRVGPRAHFKPPDACTLVDWLRAREDWHDLCLFTVGVDSMLRCGDLLALRVRDLIDRHGQVQADFFYGQEKTDREVSPILTWTAREACQKWIEVSGKRPEDYLFTGTKHKSARHINDDTYRKRVKAWAEVLGLNPDGYSTHSLRRSKPHFMYRRGVRIEYISELLGHKNTATTLRYLGITREEAQEQALTHDIFKRKLHRFPKRQYQPLNPYAQFDVFTAGFDELRSDLRELRGILSEIQVELSKQGQINAQHGHWLQDIHDIIKRGQ